MDYRGTLDWLYGLQKYGIKFGLENISDLLGRLGAPHLSLKTVHVAGTNGKGSVCAYLDSVLRASGHRVGLYTSPHLVRFNERIQVDGVPIPDGDLVAMAQEVRAAVEAVSWGDGGRSPTFFEATTALAFLYFLRKRVDIAVIEVGMGGRLDATNVLSPLVTVITRLGLEHTEYLGDTIQKIAFEKAGIIKPGVPCVSLFQKGLGVIRRRCRELGSPLALVHRDISVERLSTEVHGQRIRVRGKRDYLLSIPLLGNFQPENAALAVGAIEELREGGWRILGPSIRRGFATTSWPARLQVVWRRPLTVVDCTHTADGARRLAESVRETFRFGNLILVVGVLKDKDLGGILHRVAPLATRAIAVQPETERAIPAHEVAKALEGHGLGVEVVPSVPRGVAAAMDLAHPADLVLITGSLYTAGEALEYLDLRRRERIGNTLRRLQVLHMPGEFPGDVASTTLAKVRKETEDPFVVLISTILSQRTRDPVTEAATWRLFERYPDPASLARAHLRSIQALIRPVNFYPTKARAIKEVARIIASRYRGEVPRTYEELLRLPMVGRKTAGCVMVYGFGEAEAGIPVDAHVHRIVTERLGWVRSAGPEETETKLMDVVPREYWLALNEVLVRHGQTVCLPRAPRCPSCPVTDSCDYYQARATALGSGGKEETRAPLLRPV